MRLSLAVAAIALGLAPASSAAGLSKRSTPYMWVSGSAGSREIDGALARIDTSNGRVALFHVPTGGGGAVDADGNLWLAAFGPRRIYKIDADTGRTVSYGDGFTPRALALDASGNVFVINDQGSISKLDGSGRVIWSTALGTRGRFGIAVDAFGNAWVPSSTENNVTKIDGSNGAIIGDYPVGSYPESAAADAFGSVWISNTAGNTVTQLDASNGGVIGTYPAGRSPDGVAADASGNVWTSNYTENTVTEIRSDGTSRRFAVGAGPIGVAVDAADHVWVVNSIGRSVTELNGESGALMGTFSTGVTGASNWTGDLTGFVRQSFSTRRPVRRPTQVQPLASQSPAEALSVDIPPPPSSPAGPRSDVDSFSGRARPHPDDYALIVGIDGYRTVPHAAFGERDAEVFKRYAEGALGVPEENVIFLKGEGASRTDLAKYLEEWLPKNVAKDSRVYFYYSGHGAPDPEKGTAYLVPWDGDPEFLQSSAYPLDLLYKDLENLDAKEVVVFLDACFTGAGGRSLIASNLRPLVSVRDAPRVSRKLSVLTAASGGEVAGSSDRRGHGLFTYYLLKGLEGEASSPAAHLDLEELYQYVGRNVMKDAHRENREQHPKLTTSSPTLRLY